MLSNLTRQLTLMLAVIISITSLAATLPAYLLIRSELNEQLNQRLTEATQHTEFILEVEQRELESIVTLAAERPTLEQLMAEQDSAELEGYLNTFQENTALDQLYVSDADGAFLAGDVPLEDVLNVSYTAPVGERGFVTGRILIDSAFTQRLEEQTGFHYELYPTQPSEEGFQSSRDGVVYYHDFLSLQPLTGQPSVTLAVLLPITGLLAREQEIVVLLILTTVIVILFASVGGGLYIQRRIRPLWKLTTASLQMIGGDLSTPIVIPSTTSEISTLADVLEISRTRLQETLKELARAKDWSEALIQSVVEGIVTLDKNGTILFFSEGATQITGVGREEALNTSIDTLFQTEGDETFTDFIPPQGGRRNVFVHTSTGRHLTLAITRARPLEEGQMAIVLHDISEETQRRNLQTYFLANISHEFRTPLAGMKVSIELLLENMGHLSIAELYELLNSLYLSVSSLQNLIDNLLESSKIEANHLSLRRQPTELNAVLSNALRLVQPFLNRRGQSLMLDQPLTSPVINVDETRLAQVLVNLLSNASKYSPMDSTINIQLELRNAELYVSVADRGEGIPEEKRETIFRKFVRLSRETTSEYSSGLGLAVVKAIVEAHGGQVGVDPHEGGGAIFWFTLPLLQLEESVS